MALVKSIYICPPDIPFHYDKETARSLPPYEVSQIYAKKGMGLERDRFFGIQLRNASFLSLERIQEVVDALNIEPQVFRRNIITIGIDVSQLIGKIFKVGGVYFRGEYLCGLCRKLKTNINKPIEDYVDKKQMGIVATILSDGVIKQGDAIELFRFLL